MREEGFMGCKSLSTERLHFIKKIKMQLKIMTATGVKIVLSKTGASRCGKTGSTNVTLLEWV